MNGKKREFSDEEIEYIVKNWGKESPNKMRSKFNCSWEAICRVAKSKGLEIPTSNVWTPEEIEKLRLLATKYHYSKIAKLMNKTEKAVYLKARKLGITLIQDRKEWTKEEEKTLAELWGTKSIEKIAKKMKRSVFSLKVKAGRMGLGPMIQNNYEFITVSDICELLQVKRDRVMTTWVHLGLNLQKHQVTKNRTYYVITLEDLKHFLENNQNEWDSRILEENILGIEPEWLKEKRRKDIRENPTGYRKWTEDEIKQAESLLKMGKSYLEIAKKIKRSELAVAYLLRGMGYSYSLPQYWKGKEVKYLRENYNEMTYLEIAKHLNRTPKAVAAKVEELGFQKKLVKKDTNQKK